MLTFCNKLKCAPEKRPVLPTDPQGSPRAHDAEPTRFETFNVPAMHIATHTVLCLKPSSVWLAVILQTKILTERRYSLPPQTGRLFQIVIEKLCYIVLDHDTVLTSTGENDTEKTYELSDVNTITVGAERVRFAEVLFRQFTGKGASGIHGISFQMKCDVDIWKDLYAWPNTSICTGLVNLLQILHVVPRVTPSSHRSL